MAVGVPAELKAHTDLILIKSKECKYFSKKCRTY